MQLQGCLVRVHRVVLDRDVDRLNETSANSIRDSLNQLSLSWLLCVVDTEDILSLGRCLEDFLHHASQISHMDRRNEILTLTNDWELEWVLKPCLLEVAVEDRLPSTVEHTSRDNIRLDILLLEVQDKIFNFLDDSVLFRCSSLNVVRLLERMVEILLPLLWLWRGRFYSLFLLLLL